MPVTLIRISVLCCVFNFAFRLTGWSQSNPIQDSARYYFGLEKYGKAEVFYQQWVEKARSEKGETSAEYASALNDLGFCLGRLMQLNQADSILNRVLDIRKKRFGEESPEVATTINNLGNIFFRKGKYEKAQELYEKSYQIRQTNPGKNHLDFATSNRNLGMLFLTTGDPKKAEPFYEAYLDISIRLRNENDPELATAYQYCGYLKIQTGDFMQAEPYLKKAISIRKKVLGEDHPQLAESHQMLGVLWYEKGNYAKAETCFLQSKDIRTKHFGEDSPELSSDINNLASIYYALGLYSKAEPYYKKTISLCKMEEGDSSLTLGVYYNNLGNLYDNWKRPAIAMEYYQKALEIQLKSSGEMTPEVAWTNLNIGAMHMGLGQYHKAEKYLEKAIRIWKATLGENHPKVSFGYQNLGMLYKNTSRPAKAEINLLKNLQIQQKHFGVLHPDLVNSFLNMALHYWAVGKQDKADANFRLTSKNMIHQVSRIFPYITDSEKEKFVELLEPVQENYKSYCVSRITTRPDIAAELYNHQLATKAILLQSAAKWKHRIRTSGDQKLNSLFEEWETNQNLLAKLLQSTDSSERAAIDSLQQSCDKLEKELSRKSEAFAKLSDKKIPTWKDVQRKLKPGEAAVEMIRIHHFGMANNVQDTTHPSKPIYKAKGLTDTIYYAALIVKPTSLYPELVLLKNGNDLENKYLNYYKNQIQFKRPDQASYQQYWKKIDSRLKNIRTIYFSPDGVYHNLNLNTIENPKTQKPLLEEKDIRIVTVTRDLVQNEENEINANLAYLFGFPNFEAPFEKEKNTLALRNRSPELDYTLSPEQTKVVVSDLPGTKVEVERISDLLNNKGWEVFALTREKALEASLKETYKPRLLHIATHGFFNSGKEKEGNPLLRSGLLLSSAANSLNGRKPEDLEDGILTAYEAMNLNLDNTDLVVLSACETGLGEIKNGEGVYGLQRAFKVAGAKSIIMSLWKVDDDATQELMVSFYKHWLNSPQTPEGGLKGKNTSAKVELSPPSGDLGGRKRSAFLKAQKELKAKYPNPYYWGAFVMVGE